MTTHIPATTAILELGRAHHHPLCRFTGYTSDDWRRWRAAFLPQLRLLLGEYPTLHTAPAFDVLDTEEHPGYVRRKIVYESRLGEPIPAYLLTPRQADGPAPAALCIHGHGPGGKEDVAVPSGTPGAAYGAELAARGVVTLCPDNAGMGERGDDRGCELLWSRLNMLGMDPTGYRVHDLSRAVDVLSAMPEVDSDRIGSVGFSLGCWLAMVHAALDERVRVCVLSGRFSTFAQTIWDGRCVCQHVKGIGEVCEMPDVAGLIAPRPVCVEWGSDDTRRPVQPAFPLAKQIWRAAGAEEDLELFVFKGGHQFDGSESLPWLLARLSAQPTRRSTRR